MNKQAYMNMMLLGMRKEAKKTVSRVGRGGFGRGKNRVTTDRLKELRQRKDAPNFKLLLGRGTQDKSAEQILRGVANIKRGLGRDAKVKALPEPNWRQLTQQAQDKIADLMEDLDLSKKFIGAYQRSNRLLNSKYVKAQGRAGDALNRLRQQKSLNRHFNDSIRRLTDENIAAEGKNRALSSILGHQRKANELRDIKNKGDLLKWTAGASAGSGLFGGLAGFGIGKLTQPEQKEDTFTRVLNGFARMFGSDAKYGYTE